ncbi:hypothetical protein MUN88_02520 [Gracilibacillus caseinilyticus]|uniref:Uncharacterized protein n=1 Tax=Gracilibacillus caseinilyticus TaxID=2932256 RepID=A0ABY4EYQ2_9BACI|nr:hypothetical protein [Gracilibacillus caseinilyticus]UOQ49032.1 hypothetical protein MUN88_02520 [Gracilibacillus caseinilyticus]
MTEEECIKYFPVLQAGILMILDDMLEMLQREKDEKNYRDELASILREIK